MMRAITTNAHYTIDYLRSPAESFNFEIIEGRPDEIFLSVKCSLELYYIKTSECIQKLATLIHLLIHSHVDSFF